VHLLDDLPVKLTELQSLELRLPAVAGGGTRLVSRAVLGNRLDEPISLSTLLGLLLGCELSP